MWKSFLNLSIEKLENSNTTQENIDNPYAQFTKALFYAMDKYLRGKGSGKTKKNVNFIYHTGMIS